MNTNTQKSGEVRFALGSVVQIVVYAVIVAGAFFTFKAWAAQTLSDATTRISGIEGAEKRDASDIQIIAAGQAALQALMIQSLLDQGHSFKDVQEIIAKSQVK